MKRILTYTLLIFTIAQFLFGSGCKKEEIPTATLTTSTITNITVTSASSGGNIIDDGGSTVTVRGVCWSKGTTPTIADSKTANGAGAGTFTSSITGLTAGTIYYVRAYATNASGTGYGMAMSFTTQPATMNSELFTLLTGNIWASDSLLANGVDASGPGGMLRNFKGETKFNEDGTGYFGIYTGTWRFAYNETQIVITTDSLPLPLTTKIAELTKISLKITTSYPNLVNPSAPIKIRMSFKAK